MLFLCIIIKLVGILIRSSLALIHTRAGSIRKSLRDCIYTLVFLYVCVYVCILLLAIDLD